MGVRTGAGFRGCKECAEPKRAANLVGIRRSAAQALLRDRESWNGCGSPGAN
jgi:hypothetical protein